MAQVHSAICRLTRMQSNDDTTSRVGFVVALTILTATLVVAASQLTPTVADPDIWGHVLNGLDILDRGCADHR